MAADLFARAGCLAQRGWPPGASPPPRARRPARPRLKVRASFPAISTEPEYSGPRGAFASNDPLAGPLGAWGGFGSARGSA
jgi:hypothetical protein